MTAKQPLFSICIIWLCCFGTSINQAFAQSSTLSPYALSWALDAPLAGGGLSGLGIAFYLDAHKPRLRESDLNSLNVQQIPRFDRFAASLWSPNAQCASDVLFYGSGALPLLLLIDQPVRRDLPTVAAIAAETYLLTAALTALTKSIAQRKRPYTYNTNLSVAQRTDADAVASFFSGHTSLSATASFMTAKIYSDYHPNSPAKPYVWTAAALLPLATAYFRVRGGKHFPSDVLVGYLVGAGIGLLVPELHRK